MTGRGGKLVSLAPFSKYTMCPEHAYHTVSMYGYLNRKLDREFQVQAR